MFCNSVCPYDIEMLATFLRKLGMNLGMKIVDISYSSNSFFPSSKYVLTFHALTDVLSVHTASVVVRPDRAAALVGRL